MKKEYLYNATVTKVIDGDTVDCLVDLGFNVFVQERFRLYGIDTPEKNSKILELRELANKATDFVATQILNRQILLQSVEKDKYGRWLTKIYLDEASPTINEQLVALGLAKSYFGENKATLNWSEP